MIPVKIIKNEKRKKRDYQIKIRIYFYFAFIIIIFISILAFYLVLKRKTNQEYINKESTLEYNKIKELPINKNKSEGNITFPKRCYLPIDNSNIKILHLIITRFLIEIPEKKEFLELIKNEDYILNGIRVMKKYLIYSLENQSCTNFIWVILLGNKANKEYIKSLLNFVKGFKLIIVYENDFKNFLDEITKDYDVLITTRIDYDDQIYYDAVNDVRKTVNINKPIQLHGYNRGYFYFETEDKYYENYSDMKDGAWALFLSLVIVLKKVNATYTIYDMGNHWFTRKTILENYKSYGISVLNYEPAVIDSGDPKFIYVRQKYSHSYDEIRKIVRQSGFKVTNLNLDNFFGK